TGQPPGGGDGCTRASGNGHQLLELRQGNHGAVQTHPGATGLLQGVLPVPQVRGRWRPVTPTVFASFSHGYQLARSGRLTARAAFGWSKKWCVLSSRARTHLERFQWRSTNERSVT